MPHVAAVAAWVFLLAAGPQDVRPRMPALPAVPSQPATPAAAPDASSSLERTVKGRDGKPLDRALVLARPRSDRSGDMTRVARTDTLGRFRIVLASSEPWDVRVEAAGLAPRTLERVSIGRVLEVKLETGQ